MGIKERRERERENVRTAILDAAREMFATEGYEAVTMRQVAKRIEYSPTAIYLHFKDKEALMRALCDTDFAALAKRFSKIAKIVDPIERLRKAGLAYAEFGISNPNHYRLMFMTPHPPLKPEDSVIQHGNPEEDAYAFIVAILVDAIDQSLLRPDLADPHLAAQILWAGVHGVISLEIAKCNDPWIDWRSFRKRTELMIELIIDGITRGRS